MKNQSFCFECHQNLYFTDHIHRRNNEFEQIFTGRVPLEKGAAQFYYRKDTAIQSLLHQFKYEGKIEVGMLLGTEFGIAMMESNFHHDIDLIVPVPLYWSKQQTRGYNQAEVYARGIGKQINKPVSNSLILKEKNTISQTKMSRMERLTNVNDCFTLNNTYDVNGKHILLVDDVLTTGATLQACAELFDWNSTRISMVTMAIGRL